MSNTILITGSSSGIGKATAKYFQEKGWNVIATMRTPEKETELTELDNVLVTRLDVQDLDSINTAVQEGIEKFGTIDVVLNNAGYGCWGPLEATPHDHVTRQFDVNVIGLIDVTKTLLPHFRENKNGMFINISSVGGRVTMPLGSLYHGTKFAVEGISEGLTYELEPLGITVKIVEPGAIKTDFAGRSFDMNNDESLTEYQGLLGQMMGLFETILPNGSEPEVVAEVVYQAATDGTKQLRYTAGPDAKDFLGTRDADDAVYLANVKQMLGM